MSDESGRSHPPKSTANGDLLRLVIESVTDFAIFTEDSNGIVTSWNSGAERLLGHAAEQIIGRSGDAIYVPEDRRASIHDEERRCALAEGRAEDERWQMRRDGSRFWASGLLMPLKDGMGFAKILRDRTAQHRAEAEVRENEARFCLLATSIPQLVFLTRPDGSRTWGSPQWVGFTGLDLEASLGGGWLDAVHPDDRGVTQRAWQEAQASGEYYVEHRIRRRANDEWRWHQTRARPLPGESGSSGDWVGTSTDIHELRTLQDQQRVLLAELQHRTRNLLAVVQSIARQTLRSSDSLQDFGAEFESRLRALGRVQGLLARTDDQGVELRALIERALPYQLGARTRLEFGPDGVRCTLEVPALVAGQGAVHG